jgi:hypothetical protein
MDVVMRIIRPILNRLGLVSKVKLQKIGKKGLGSNGLTQSFLFQE